MNPEQSLFNQVGQWLTIRKFLWFKVRNSGRIVGKSGSVFFARDTFWQNQRGVADVIVLKNGHAYAFELKAPKGRVRPDQAEWLQRFASAGGTACVVRSLEEVAAAIGEKI